MKGESVFEQDGKFLTIYPGDCIAYDLSRPHVISSSSSTKHLVVIIPKNLALLRGFKLNDIATQHFSSREGIGRLTYDMVGSVFRQMTSITPECEEEVAESILRALYLPFLERRHIARPGEVLKQRAKTYIWRNIRDSDLCIDRIATSLNCTKRYLHMVFANEGTTIAKYIWMVRLERCREELEQSRNGFATITDLAFSWGFNSSSHFSRMFKDRFGVPPSHLQRQ
jgi:AraC-like DNA-binding protein